MMSMQQTIAGFLLGLGLIVSMPLLLLTEVVPLKPVEQVSEASLGWDEQLWGSSGKSGDKQALVSGIDRSLHYLNTASAAKVYQNYPLSGVSRDRVRRSLRRFRQLLIQSRTPAELQAAVKREFVWYQSVGNDGQGTVAFTGYFEPIYAASRKRNAEYRYPLYRLPSHFNRWAKPHPSRAELEGKDGLLAQKSPLAGSELVWLRDRLEAFLVHIQGSAKLRLPDGKLMSVGYAGNTDYPYTSIGRELVNEGIFTLEELSLPVLIDYLQQHPQDLAISAGSPALSSQAWRRDESRVAVYKRSP